MFINNEEQIMQPDSKDNDDDQNISNEPQVDKKTFLDEEIPTFAELRMKDYDNLRKHFKQEYGQCEDSRKVIKRLNTVIFKKELEEFIDEKFKISEAIMTLLINYLINFQRLQKETDGLHKTYFMLYSAPGIKKEEIYHPKLNIAEKFAYAHEHLLQPSIEEIKQQIENQAFKGYKYLALLVRGRNKWFISLTDLQFKHSWLVDYCYEMKSNLKKYEQFITDLVLQEISLDLRGIVLIDQVELIDDKGDQGDRIFYLLYKLLIGKQEMQDKNFLTWEELQRAYKRTVWLVLRFMQMTRDPKEDEREKQKSMFQQLRLEEEKKRQIQAEIEKKLQDEVRLKQQERESYLFSQMLEGKKPQSIQTEVNETPPEVMQKLLKFNQQYRLGELESFVLNRKANREYNYNYDGLAVPNFELPQRYPRAKIQKVIPSKVFNIPERKVLPPIQFIDYKNLVVSQILSNQKQPEQDFQLNYSTLKPKENEKEMLQRYLKLYERNNNLIPEPNASGFFKNDERILYNRGTYGGYVMKPRQYDQLSNEVKISDKVIDYKNVNALNLEIERMNEEVNTYLRQEQQYHRKFK